jgi:hypothetical protein
MDQGTTPEVNIIGLLGKKKKPLPKLSGELTIPSSGVKKKLARYGPSCKLYILLCIASSGHRACLRGFRLLAHSATVAHAIGKIDGKPNYQPDTEPEPCVAGQRNSQLRFGPKN